VKILADVNKFLTIPIPADYPFLCPQKHRDIKPCNPYLELILLIPGSCLRLRRKRREREREEWGGGEVGVGEVVQSEGKVRCGGGFGGMADVEATGILFPFFSFCSASRASVK